MSNHGWRHLLGLDKRAESQRNAEEYKTKYAAISSVQAVIEFDLDGNILSANEHFLRIMGYAEADILGQHHSLFVMPAERDSADYREFWRGLREGHPRADEFRRITKAGREVWLQASYIPVRSSAGHLTSVVKVATDITARKLQAVEVAGQLAAINRSQAVIEFDIQGNVLTANQNFLDTMGYTLEEIKGRHHALFVDPRYGESTEYRAFWRRLAAGEFMVEEFKRLRKNGQEIWLQASYNPILDLQGKPFKVVKFASDITQRKLQNADFRGQVDAINRSQAVIEFSLDGNVLHANENFLSVMGYSLEEIRGKHHSLFVDPAEVNTHAYQQFWADLNAGKMYEGEFHRIGKNKREVWIQASYYPILNLDGKPYKVVKYAIDITEQKIKNADFNGQITAINRAQAVIEFDLQGNILRANDNFLNAMGYRLNEIVGKHHSLFVEKGFAESATYREFWERLRGGEFIADEFKRLGKNRREVWIQASYNPIFNSTGQPYKIVKYATDITARKYAINRISQSLLALSEGRLNGQINENLSGEFDSLKEALNSTLDRLGSMVNDIARSADAVNNAGVEIQHGTFDLSKRTEEQAASLEETASSMEELNEIVHKTAENSKNARQETQSASNAAEKGGQVVAKAVQAMQEIETASKRIADIIGVIDEIAFQTNLLALNAAVEAARAGEQGRGFAVVAGEVRNLAQRSAQAAKEIKGLINSSVEKVTEGSRLVNESGKTLSEIISYVSNVTRMVVDISGASQEQASGINQVTDAVSQMDSAVQQNAAMVEQALAATTSMSEESAKLTSLIAFFTK